jgi:glutamine synthetase
LEHRIQQDAWTPEGADRKVAAADAGPAAEGAGLGNGRAAARRTSLAYLQEFVARRSLQTVVLAGVDFQGRLYGKRLDASFFLERAAEGTLASVAALANDISLELVADLSFGGWESGFPDVLLKPDYATVRLLPWRPGTALVLADIVTPAGEDLPVSPRSVLRRQVERAAGHGFGVYAGSELEFYLLRESAESARAKHYTGLEPASNFPADYNLLRSSRDEWFYQELRTALAKADIPVESSKSEWGHGQGELNLAYADVLEMADRHAVFKQGVKEVAEQHGMLVTFMAKPFTEQPGSGCHLHVSLRRLEDERPVFYDPAAPHHMSATMRHFLGGVQQLADELFIIYAPYVNSYKRFVPDSFAPCRNVWGLDNRTSAFRISGQEGSLRIENRIPGADVNPYLANAAMLASGLYGIEHGLEPAGGPESGNICDRDGRRFPVDLPSAIARLESSTRARELLGERLVSDLLAFARSELDTYSRQVTDWERRAYLEQI